MGNILRSAYLRTKAVEYLWTFLHIPYFWGGDDPMAGFDCSGLVIRILQAVGRLSRGFDTTADGLWKKYSRHEVRKGYAGCLVFWFVGDRAVHVEMMIDDLHVIGASGGGSEITSLEKAILRNAFVQMNPVGYRKQAYRIVDPFRELDDE